jgi:hypothetical protein
LRRAYGCHIAARAATNNDDIKLLTHVFPSFSGSLIMVMVIFAYASRQGKVQALRRRTCILPV